MSPTITSLTRSTQDRMLTGLEAGQAVATNAVGAVSNMVVKVVPEKLRSLDAVPGSSSLPTPRETVELTWGFAEQVMARQRMFADSLINAAAIAAAVEPAPES